MPRDRQRINDRDAALYAKYKELYDVRRKRYDDVLNELADAFYLMPQTVHKIILEVAKKKAEAET